MSMKPSETPAGAAIVILICAVLAISPVAGATTMAAQPLSTTKELPTAERQPTATAPNCAAVSYHGNGTTKDPYQVSNVSQLQCIANQSLSAHYALTANIDASETADWNQGRGFDPIGGNPAFNTTAPPFTGSLDGRNHTITGLTIDRRASTVGLFGYIDGTTQRTARVANLELRDVNITASAYTGGLVGILEAAHVTNVRVTGRVIADSSQTRHKWMGLLAGSSIGSELSRVSTRGRVVGQERIGGVVGGATDGGKIVHASSVVNVTATVEWAGGLAGTAITTPIRNAYTVAHVRSPVSGGLIGAGSYSSDGYDIEGAYWAGTVSSGPTDTGSDGNISGVSRLTTADLTGATATDTATALAFDGVWQTVEDGYPVLRSLPRTQDESSGNASEEIVVPPSALAGSGTPDDPYVITNASELQAITALRCWRGDSWKA